MKFGARNNYTELRRVSQNNQNGTFRFMRICRSMRRIRDLPRTVDHPEPGSSTRPSRTGPSNCTPRTSGRSATLDPEPRRPLRPRDHPDRRDRQSVVPSRPEIADRPQQHCTEIGFTHALDDDGKSVVRGGYGIFHNRTVLGAIEDALEFPKFSTSIVALFPNDTADAGPGARPAAI